MINAKPSTSKPSSITPHLMEGYSSVLLRLGRTACKLFKSALSRKNGKINHGNDVDGSIKDKDGSKEGRIT